MYFPAPSRGDLNKLTETCQADNLRLSRIEPDAGPEGPAPVMSGPDQASSSSRLSASSSMSSSSSNCSVSSYSSYSSSSSFPPSCLDTR